MLFQKRKQSSRNSIDQTFRDCMRTITRKSQNDSKVPEILGSAIAVRDVLYVLGTILQIHNSAIKPDDEQEEEESKDDKTVEKEEEVAAVKEANRNVRRLNDEEGEDGVTMMMTMTMMTMAMTLIPPQWKII